MIEVSGLRKSYRTKRGRKATKVEAVRGVDFAVQQGEIFGFLGPNGAGKTTTLRMLATLIRPDGGDATIAGVDLRRVPAQVRRRIGFVAQASGTYDQSTARRDLVHQARMYGMPKADGAEPRRGGHRGVPARGLRRPPDRHLLRRPAPAAGRRARRDPFARRSSSWTSRPPGSTRRAGPGCGRRSASSATGGMTVFLTTHYLDEADALCDRISIIDGGVIVAEGTPADLKREISGDVVIVDLAAAGHGRRTGAGHDGRSRQDPERAACVQSCETIDAHPAALRGQQLPRPCRRSCAR